MKKSTFLFIAAGILTFSLHSCSKTHECHCELVASDDHVDIEIEGKKSEAESACKALEINPLYSECDLH